MQTISAEQEENHFGSDLQLHAHDTLGISASHSSNFDSWLNSQNISLALTTYQSSRLMLLGVNERGECGLFERFFERAMGMYATTEHLYLSSRYQLWQFDNDLAVGDTYKGFDKVYLPRIVITTGDLDIHDLVVVKDKSPIFVDTRYSCLATAPIAFWFW